MKDTINKMFETEFFARVLTRVYESIYYRFIYLFTFM